MRSRNRVGIIDRLGEHEFVGAANARSVEAVHGYRPNLEASA